MFKSLLRYTISIILIFLPETNAYGIKRFLYRLKGCHIGKNTRICSSAKIYAAGKVIIGDNVWIGPEVFISSAPNGEIIIEDFARIGVRSIIVNGFHEITPESDCIIAGNNITENVKIKKGSSVGTRCIILPGKTIGEMSHVAAGSVVTKDVPSYARVAGVPAKVIKDLRTK